MEREDNVKTILKSKTFWAAIVQFLIAVVMFFNGQIDLKLLIGDFVAMLLLIFYRDDIGINLQKLLNGYFAKVKWFKDGVFWTVLAGILGSVAAWLGGQLTLMQMLLAVSTALIGFFLRQAQVPES
jgi:hypothetical protein